MSGVRVAPQGERPQSQHCLVLHDRNWGYYSEAIRHTHSQGDGLPIDRSGRFYMHGEDPAPDPPAVASLYAVERQIGSSIQKDILSIWFAATTYFTAAIGIIVLLHNSSIAIGPTPKIWVLFALPLVACAFAGYHLILFGIGAVHSRSIEHLEREMISQTTTAVQKDWRAVPSRIGSRAETDWTNYGKAEKWMKIAQFVAFLPPYAFAIALAAVALVSIPRMAEYDLWAYWAYWPFLAIYIAIAVTYLVLGVKSINILNEA
jgi:hypothetical protein